MSKLSSNRSGFTLMELMVTVAIIAIIAAIAIPSYRQYIKRTHENKVKSLMLNYAIQMEQWRAKTLTYAGFTPTALRQGDNTTGLGDLEGDNETINYPANSKITDNNIVYTITIDAVSGDDTPTFSALKTSTMANRWIMLAVPKDTSLGLASIGMTSTGIKCQNSTTSVSLADLWNPSKNCGTGGTSW